MSNFNNVCNDVCLCGARRGSEHAAVCPFPCYCRDPFLRATWERDKFVLGEMRANTEDLKKRLEESKVKK